jgi:hypothetical protein
MVDVRALFVLESDSYYSITGLAAATNRVSNTKLGVADASQELRRIGFSLLK